MSKLTACFTIPLDRYLFAKHKVEKEFEYKTKIDEFDVHIQLLPYKKGPTGKFSNEEELTYCISLINVSVSKNLPDEIPPIIKSGESNDYSLRVPYFSKCTQDFQRVAQAAVNRVIKYFKYVLKNPLLELLPEYSQCFLSPSWFDENENKINPGVYVFSSRFPEGLTRRDFGIKPLSTELEPELMKAIDNEIKTELCEEVLLDAQSAIFQNNYRRAVLEMAMACELSIRQIYFSKSSAAGLALEFIEDSQRMSPRVKITDYIANIAEYALGEKFEDSTSKADFTNIDNLFRGRNKVVHSGELSFKDENGKLHKIDISVLKEWWRSVERLLAWLNSKKTA
jgi:hypothetical protein